MSEEQSIATVLENYGKFVNASDAAQTAALYTKEAILFPDRMDTAVGSEAILGFYTYAFSLLTLKLEFSIDLKDIIVNGDFAYATTSSTGTRLFKESGQTVPEINRELWNFEKVAGEWKIARYMFNKTE